MGIFYSYTWEPWKPLESFDKSKLPPDRNDLAVELHRLGLRYTYWDYTSADFDHARRKQQIAEELRPWFEEEGTQFLFENHIGEAKGIQQAFAADAHARFLYLVQYNS